MAGDLNKATPLSHTSGLRSYRLFRDKADKEGVTVFDLGKGFVEVSYDDGTNTVVAEVLVTSIPEGFYTRAQVVHTHVRYRIKATAHNGGFAIPGEFDNVQVMSDGATLDGAGGVVQGQQLRGQALLGGRVIADKLPRRPS